MITSWNGKPYHSLDYMLKQRFGEKVYKVTLNGRMSCPNRDGTIGQEVVFSVVPEAAVILLRTQLFPLQSRLTARSLFYLQSVLSTSTSPIFRLTPILMPRWIIWKGFFQKPFLIRGSWLFPLVPGRIALVRT